MGSVRFSFHNNLNYYFIKAEFLSFFFSDRKSLESSMQPGFNEIILLDSNTQNIYEGLSSNFFAVLYNPDKQEPLVVTAPIHHVLEGTILKIVRMICERDKIDFQFWFPNANDAEQWKGAFITSKFLRFYGSISIITDINLSSLFIFRHVSISSAN